MSLSKSLQEEEKKKERRRAWRLSPAETFQVKFTKGKLLKRRGQGDVKDISGTGFFFSTPARLRKGHKLALSLQFPKGFPSVDSVSLDAAVTRVLRKDENGEYGIGCRILKMNQESEETVRQFLWWLELNGGEPFFDHLAV